MERSVTFEVAPNIALIKYWGKRDGTLNLPHNSSLSITLSSENLNTRTTASLSSAYERDELCFGEETVDLSADKRIAKMVNMFRELSRIKKEEWDPERREEWEWKINCPIHVSTRNCFPTGAGMASSASGFACLALCLSHLYNIYDQPEEIDQLSALTRQASGSACRSLFGGLVYWKRGELETGVDSIATPVLPPTYWPELRIAICVTAGSPKKVGSTEGMNRCMETSEEMKKRTPAFVETRIEKAIQAFKNRDFNTLGSLIMSDSDHLHSICETAIPPIHYLNNLSEKVKGLVSEMNREKGEIAYSFDAGPNPFLFYEAKHADWLEGRLIRELQPQKVLRAGEGEQKELVGTGEIELMLLTRMGEGPRKVF